jgi:hypothetical protein
MGNKDARLSTRSLNHYTYKTTSQVIFESRDVECVKVQLKHGEKIGYTEVEEGIILETYSVAGIASTSFTWSCDFHDLPTAKTVITSHRICKLDPR